MNFAKVMKVTKQRAALDSIGAPRSAHGGAVALEYSDESGISDLEDDQPDSGEEGLSGDSCEPEDADDLLVDGDLSDDDEVSNIETQELYSQEDTQVLPVTYSPDDVAMLLLDSSHRGAPKKTLPRGSQGAKNSQILLSRKSGKSKRASTGPEAYLAPPLKKPALRRQDAIVSANVVAQTPDIPVDVENDFVEVRRYAAEANGIAEPMKKGKRDGFRVNNFVFTMYGFTDETKKELLLLVEHGIVEYIGFGVETCPETKRLHLQGVGQIGKQCAWSTIAKKTSLFDDCAVFLMRGTIEVARHYCMKGDAIWVTGRGLQNPCSNANFLEAGNLVRKPGHKKSNEDLHSAMNHLRSGKPVDDLLMMEEFDGTVIKHYKTLCAISARFQLKRKRGDKPTVFWWWGPTGCGKTESVYERWEKKFQIWQSSNSMQWFDGYEGQEVAIFDDFRPDQCTFAWLLRLLDQYALKVPIKGGFVEWNPKIIVITCPFEIDDCDFKFTFGGAATNKAYDLAQLKRRVTATKEFKVLVKNEDGTYSNDVDVVEID